MVTQLLANECNPSCAPGPAAHFRSHVKLDLCALQSMALVASIKTQLKNWKALLTKLNVESGCDVEMIKVVEGYALR